MRQAEQGFTLIELVMVIVLLAIVATISVQFVVLSTRGAIDTAERQQRALKAVVVSEQISRMLREALPLSVRTVGPECIEWLPITGATRYHELPEEGEPSIAIVGFDTVPAGTDLRAAVYGYGRSPDTFHTSPVNSPGPVSPVIASIDNSSTPPLVTFSNSHVFEQASPARRLFIVGRPMALCVEGSAIALYREYTPGSAYSSGQREVLAANLVGDTSFDYTPPSLRRAAVVSFSFELGSPQSDETLNVTQEVQIRNVP